MALRVDATLARRGRSLTNFGAESAMNILGSLLLLAGWGIVLAALVLLTAEAPRTGFVLAGVGVEALGLALMIRAHLMLRSGRD